jgi:mono/diheme cytochrome c family protein
MAKDRKFALRQHLPSVAFVVAAALALAALMGILMVTGVYNIGADAPHTRPVHWLIEAMRDRSIAVRARSVSVPADLNSPRRIAAGAGLYAEMCSGCHLAPGMEKTEISQGLYPEPPAFSEQMDKKSPAEAFWVIKHGVKMTAMPAWGRTHNDDLIWDMVSFVGKLPSLSPAQYKDLVASAPAEHEEMMMEAAPGGHTHEGETLHH